MIAFNSRRSSSSSSLTCPTSPARRHDEGSRLRQDLQQCTAAWAKHQLGGCCRGMWHADCRAAAAEEAQLLLMAAAGQHVRARACCALCPGGKQLLALQELEQQLIKHSCCAVQQRFRHGTCVPELAVLACGCKHLLLGLVPRRRPAAVELLGVQLRRQALQRSIFGVLASAALAAQGDLPLTPSFSAQSPRL